ncbi:MAG: tRNA preQ1(34) S-adenosylmethionine ribosyltransferase-isomerase QueA, partial [Proteobacteria bacterium]|nr:tRNA preQ1(34) S-adenosylmethionine ribosyltransferase-isomerase QueA [Pseudomonadota bacterium]
LVLNDSKVLPARLKATKDTGGIIDILLVERISDNRWFCLANGVKRGVTELRVSVGNVEAGLTKGEGFWVIEFFYDGDIYDIIKKYGKMPLPPYIKRKENDGSIDFDRYQTVYAEALGSIAAPTAGFHFTHELLDRIKGMGINIVKITLHIGVGTFFLVKKRNIEEHVMHSEYYHITHDARTYIKRTKAQGRRIVACGTSVVRALETLSMENGNTPPTGKTRLFIYPNYRFKMVDALITNFHLPRSTPLLLVSAFAGKEEIFRCYREALKRGYRFYSYGDAMFIC